VYAVFRDKNCIHFNSILFIINLISFYGLPVCTHKKSVQTCFAGLHALNLLITVSS